MPVNTKYRFLISSQLGINLPNLDLDAPAAANFRGGYLVTFACSSRGMFGARLPA
jgi:hypothetical protein